MTNTNGKSNGPKDAVTSKGPNAKAVGAIAMRDVYNRLGQTDKEKPGVPAGKHLECSARAREGLAKPLCDKKAARMGKVAFRASGGRVWTYTGKRARVLAMLATTGKGVTQWDTLPWHTRLGGTIHAMREDGLEIDTVLEGEFRNARYWLRTEGTLSGGQI